MQQLRIVLCSLLLLVCLAGCRAKQTIPAELLDLAEEQQADPQQFGMRILHMQMAAARLHEQMLEAGRWYHDLLRTSQSDKQISAKQQQAINFSKRQLDEYSAHYHATQAAVTKLLMVVSMYSPA